MIYRPHFVFAVPRGCSIDGYEHYFDTTNVPAQTVTLAQGIVFGILFQLDKDAQFLWRGFKVATPAVDPGLEVQWKDGEGNLLSDDTVNVLLYASNQGYGRPFTGGMSVVFREQVVCPPGSVIESNWARSNSGSAANIPPAVTLLGAKRRYNERTA